MDASSRHALAAIAHESEDPLPGLRRLLKLAAVAADRGARSAADGPADEGALEALRLHEQHFSNPKQLARLVRMLCAACICWSNALLSAGCAASQMSVVGATNVGIQVLEAVGATAQRRVGADLIAALATVIRRHAHTLATIECVRHRILCWT